MSLALQLAAVLNPIGNNNAGIADDPNENIVGNNNIVSDNTVGKDNFETENTVGNCDTGPKDLLQVGDGIVKVDVDMIRYVNSVKDDAFQGLKKGLAAWGLRPDLTQRVDKIKERDIFKDLLAEL